MKIFLRSNYLLSELWPLVVKLQTDAATVVYTAAATRSHRVVDVVVVVEIFRSVFVESMWMCGGRAVRTAHI